MTATHYTGFHGTLTVDAGPTAVAEFSLKIDRSEATHARSGFYSDLKVPGKINATGTITRIMITKDFLDDVLDANILTLVGAVDDGTNSITATIGNVFLTTDEFKFTDADSIVSEPITFGVKDADTDIAIVELPA